jgi:hypothetical protein
MYIFQNRATEFDAVLCASIALSEEFPCNVTQDECCGTDLPACQDECVYTGTEQV